MTRPNFTPALWHNPIMDFGLGLIVGCSGDGCDWTPTGDPFPEHREHLIAELNRAVDEWLAPFAAAVAAKDD